MIERAAIPGYPGHYATRAGVVMGPRERPRSFGPLKTRPGRWGYLRVSLNVGDGRWRAFTVHSLVALAFIGPRPEGQHVGHLNGDHLDNRPENLSYVTPKENEAHKLSHGRRVIGEKQPKAVLTDETVRWIRKHYKSGDREFGASALARRFGLHNTTVLFAATGKTWRHVHD